MAIKKTIEIDVNSQKAEQSVGELIQQFDTLGQETQKSLSNIEKGVEKVEKNTNLLAKGFKTAGLALKAMGIGLAIDAFNTLKDLFFSNQKIADGFGVALKGLGIIFNDFFDLINNNIGRVTDFFKEIFENPKEAIKDLGIAIRDNLIERFTSLLEVSGFLSKALKSLFEGDFAGALDSVKEAGKEMADVFTGVDDTVGKVGKFAEEVGKYASNVFDSAKALQAQENAALRAAAIQAGLVEEYDRQAESLRQIRDNDLLSVEERVKANNELGEVLQKQRTAMLEQAQLQVRAAQNQFNLNRSIENEVALIEARNNVKAVEAQINGFLSEQLTNKNALEKEGIEIAKSAQETQTQIAINQKLFNAERIKDEEAKLLAQKEAIENERILELERLQNNINLYKQGTQARVDAENEYLLKKQELDNALIAKEDEIANLRIQKQSENNLRVKELRDQELANQQVFEDQKFNIASQGIGLISSLFGESQKVAKGILILEQSLAIAQIITNASRAIAQAKANLAATPAAIGIVPNPMYIVQAAATAKGIAATKLSAGISIATILAQTIGKLSGGKNVGGAAASSTGSVAGGGAGGATPQFNIVGGNVANQLGQVLGNQPPVQAFVVGSQVTSQQALDRNIITNASLG